MLLADLHFELFVNAKEYDFLQMHFLLQNLHILPDSTSSGHNFLRLVVVLELV